jgi:chaperonin cofactor prefoldin
MLEQVVQELPKIYRQKFEDRMETVRDKVKTLQNDNRRLQAELQSVSYRLAVRTRRSQQLDLPSFSGDSISLPGFSS